MPSSAPERGENGAGAVWRKNVNQAAYIPLHCAPGSNLATQIQTQSHGRSGLDGELPSREVCLGLLLLHGDELRLLRGEPPADRAGLLLAQVVREEILVLEHLAQLHKHTGSMCG